MSASVAHLRPSCQSQQDPAQIPSHWITEIGQNMLRWLKGIIFPSIPIELVEKSRGSEREEGIEVSYRS